MMHALPGHIGEVIHKVIAEYKTFNETDNEMIGAMAYTIGVQRNRIAEYKTFNETDNEMIDAMAYTIGVQRSRIMELERKVQELQKGRTT